MYLLTNAMKNLIRNRGRNTLIAAVTLAIILSTVVTLTISNASTKVIDAIRLNLGSRVEIKQDFIEMRQAGLDGRTDASYISLEQFENFAQSDYLTKTIFSAEMYAGSSTFFAIGDETKGTGTRINDNGEEVIVETLKLVATSDSEMLRDFGSEREIIDGRMFESLNECVIGEELAALNGVSVGDIIEIIGASYAPDKAFSLTVVGIFSDVTDEYNGNWFLSMYGRFADNRRNEVITSWETLISAGWESNHGLNMTSEYFLKDPDDITEFEAEVRAQGLPVTYGVSINQAAYDKVAGPMSSMKGAVTTFMIVILILGAIVLALLSFIAVRERKYEVGVLRAMGMERGKVAFGIIAEAVMISIMCLVVGLSAGGLMVQPIADGILEGRVATAEAEESPMANKAIFAGGQAQIGDGASGYAPESEIQVSLGADTIMQIIILTLLLAALSGVIGVVIIIQYEPLKILRER
ncbi:MAG: FtsX-like permease family protein [Oscillospiraceae bacterium]|nr:FtsX-like permease family protein [Oscillospiraceae bacterium]